MNDSVTQHHYRLLLGKEMRGKVVVFMPHPRVVCSVYSLKSEALDANGFNLPHTQN